MPGPHMLTPPPNHATSVRHYCPLCNSTARGILNRPKNPSVVARNPRGKARVEPVLTTQALDWWAGPGLALREVKHRKNR